MYIDSQLQFSTGQAPGNSADQVASTNVVNMGSAKQAFAEGQATVTLRVSTAFGGTAGVWVEVQTSNVEDFASGVKEIAATPTLHSSGNLSLGTVGTQIDIPLPAITDGAQYLRLAYNTGGSAGSGAFDAFVAVNLQDN